MSDILEKLYAAKAAALEEEQRRESLAQVVERGLRRRAERRSLSAVLRNVRGPAIIAEIKRASPSLGLIARNFEPADIAAAYERAGADAISVLTEADHFLGDLAYLDIARAHTTRPILRKDFLTVPYQIAQASAYGADAVLLIVAGLTDEQLHELSEEARRFDLDTVVEIHDEEELRRALPIRPSVLGINNRDLRTFTTDLGVTEYLLPHIPPDVLVVSESGVQNAGDIAKLHARGAHGFLVGESLMRAEDPVALMHELKHGSALRH
jgi:indole-3-glycerol phosphate synthase